MAVLCLGALMLTAGAVIAADAPGTIGGPPVWGTKKNSPWPTPPAKAVKKKAAQDLWACPMMCVKLDKPGKCPKCKMDLEKLRSAPKPGVPKVQRSKDVYVCPMCDIKSGKPGKCSHCGMEMVKFKPKDPNAPLVYRCDRCSMQGDKPGECPHHCGGKMVVKE